MSHKDFNFFKNKYNKIKHLLLLCLPISFSIYGLLETSYLCSFDYSTVCVILKEFDYMIKYCKCPLLILLYYHLPHTWCYRFIIFFTYLSSYSAPSARILTTHLV